MKILIIIILSFGYSAPGYTVITNNNPYPGKIFIHSMPEYMSILDHNLQPYWIINNLPNGMDFKLNNSKLSYFHKPSNYLNEAFWIIADDTMTEIDTAFCTQGLTDYHDMIITDNNTYIMQAYNTQVFDLSSIGGDPYTLIDGVLIIQEFDLNGNLIFHWDASQRLDILDYADILYTGNPIIGRIEWMHGNSIDIDYDNNLILSNRRSNEIIKIDRQNGEVLWILGGPLNEFQFIDDPFNGPAAQHDVTRLDNGNILVFDNGNLDTYPASRVIEYTVNEISKTATLQWEFYNPNGYIARAMGSAQRLPNGNTFINWGTLLTEGIALGASIMEIDIDENIVLEIQYDIYQSYKVTKSDFEFSIPMGLGDTNLDNLLNIQDVIYSVDYVLYHEGMHSIFHLYKIDTNIDGLINIIDIIDIVNRILTD